MILRLRNLKRSIFSNITLPASKSISNRCLIIQSLCEDNITLENLSLSSDTLLMQKALQNNGKKLNLENAGTTFRFLTAYFALKGKEVVLTGSDDMKLRPIGPLVDALRQLGAKIDYIEKEEYPPIKIYRGNLNGYKVKVSANISSQYISALLLISPCLPNGLKLEMEGEILSKPYIDMTIHCMNTFGVSVFWDQQVLMIKPQKYLGGNNTIEGDWSSASYWYGLAALSNEAKISINNLSSKSIQGDKVIVEIMKEFGVETIENGNITIRKKEGFNIKDNLKFDFRHCPDLALTIAVVAAGLKINCELTGLQALPIKESDRLTAVCTELKKLEYVCIINNKNSLIIKPSTPLSEPNLPVETYHDHRVAMAFSLLSLRHLFLEIREPDVIKKSYSNYWNDLKEAGFDMKFYD